MQIEPQATAFAKRYARGEGQVVWTTLVSDLETPVSAFLKVADGRPMSFLLESVEGGALRGRYSIIGLDPDLVWRARGRQAEINRTARSRRNRFAPCNEPPLSALRALIAESRIELPEALPPMAAGIFGYLGYDMVRLMEELPTPNPDPIGIADAMLLRPTIVMVFDSVTDTITVVTPVRPETGVAAEAAFAALQPGRLSEHGDQGRSLLAGEDSAQRADSERRRDQGDQGARAGHGDEERADQGHRDEDGVEAASPQVSQVHGERALAGSGVTGAVAQVVDREQCRGQEAEWHRAGQRQPRQSPVLHERGAGGRDHAEEHEHEDLSQAVVAVGTGPARVGPCRGDAGRPDEEQPR